MWHSIAPKLTKKFTVIIPDLRGYGNSMTPESDASHLPYSKRIMADDMKKLMTFLGFEKFFLAGHGRGGRVAHRLARDHPKSILALSVIDICPTLDMYEATNMHFSKDYFHWFFLIQPEELPEKLIGANPEIWVKSCLKNWSGNFDFGTVEQKYISAFSKKCIIHSTCEDYRASATIDLVHDKEDQSQSLSIPTQVIWGKKGLIDDCFDSPKIWKKYFNQEVMACPVACGHFIPEELPEQVVSLFNSFFGSKQ